MLGGDVSHCVTSLEWVIDSEHNEKLGTQIIIIIIIITITTTIILAIIFTHGIYSYVPETNHVSTVHTCTVLQLFCIYSLCYM